MLTRGPEEFNNESANVGHVTPSPEVEQLAVGTSRSPRLTGRKSTVSVTCETYSWRCGRNHIRCWRLFSVTVSSS